MTNRDPLLEVKIKKMIDLTLDDINRICPGSVLRQYIDAGSEGTGPTMLAIDEAAQAGSLPAVKAGLSQLRKIAAEAISHAERERQKTKSINILRADTEEAAEVQAEDSTLKIKKSGWTNLGEATRPKPVADWLWRGWLREGLLSVVVAYGESGKGMLVSGLALAVAAGSDYLGHPCSQGKVLIISAEDDTEEMLSRLLDIAAALGLDRSHVKNNIAIYSTIDTGVPPSLLDKNMQPSELLKEIQRVVKAVKPKLVILDTLAAMAPAGADLISATTATQYLCGVGAFLRPDDGPAPAILFTHHPRKPGKDTDGRPTIHDVRDSGAIVGSMRSVMILHKEILTLDKCNGRRRVESEYRVDRNDASELEWKSAIGCNNGALVLKGKSNLIELEAAERQRLQDDSDFRAARRREEKEAVRKNDAAYARSGNGKAF